MYARKDRLDRLRCPLDLAEVQHQSDPGPVQQQLYDPKIFVVATVFSITIL